MKITNLEGQAPNSMYAHMPTVFERGPDGVERAFDLPSRLMKDRIILLNGAFDEFMARSIVSQLLFLDGQDDSRPIQIYINSPGGVVTDGMAILDTMKFIKSEVHTIVMGVAASMGAFIAACGDKRFALPNAEIMIHQPLGGAQGQATDIAISADRIVKMKKRLTQYLAHQTKQDFDVIERDMERDKWLYANEALDYGLVDEIIQNQKDFPTF